jgi:hypothetical protein
MKATADIKYAFGCSATPFDSIQSFVAGHGGDKESVDRLVYRVGKQICTYDPENGSQNFFSGRHRSVTNVLHFSISLNQKYISMCESLSQDNTDDNSANIVAQLSVYSLVTLARLKTLSHTCKADFVSSSFCGDPKYIAALSGESDRQIIVWYWEKEKIHKAMHLTFPVTRLRSAPCANLMVTTSGPGVLKSWFIGPDGAFRPSALLPATKESENFIDHCWLNQMTPGLSHKMVALTDPDSACVGLNMAASGVLFMSSSDGGAAAATTNTTPMGFGTGVGLGFGMGVGMGLGAGPGSSSASVGASSSASTARCTIMLDLSAE